MNSTRPSLTAYINLETDVLIPLTQARMLFPAPPCLTTLWRWRTRGINGVKLPALKCGSRWVTTKRAINEFIRQQNSVNQPVTANPDGRTPELTRDLHAARLL